MRTLVVAALLLPAAAAAQRGVGIELGLRLAYAPSLGNAAGLVPMSEAVDVQVPIQLDAAWATETFGAGTYVSWAPGQAGAQGCTDGASCSAQVTRAGVQAIWKVREASLGGAMPWLGGGLGWEWASHRRERLGAATTTRWNGPELSLQGGAAWRAGERFTVGPYLLVGVGWYERVTIETAESSGSGSLGDRAVHGWIHVGVRGTAAFFF
ncbi:MAG TPA: hypothetical protein VFL83_00715 [Anaeromyxobacter sp.]|nr:hypothetical protein [Anaeromyxobacter sp.]